jgi:hypothetical protein
MEFDATYWRTARSRVKALKVLDANCKLVFASDAHRYEVLPPVREGDIAGFERRNGIQLPLEYRLFLLHCGAGGAGPDYGLYAFADLEPWHVAERFPLLQTQAFSEDDDDPLWRFPGLLCLGTAGCAIDWYLEVNGSVPGTMWVDAGPGEALTRVASFGAWYSAWLERVEVGLRKHARLYQLVASGATMSEIVQAMDTKTHRSRRDDRDFLTFHGVPGRLEVDGERVVRLDVSTNWMQ